MKAHTVKQGEDMISIAQTYHIVEWQDIYNHTANKRLKEFRPDPMQLKPGDLVYIPETEPIKYTFSTNQIHKIIVNVPRTKISITMLDDQGEPIQYAKYELDLDETQLQGQTDGQGLVETEVNAALKSAVLRIWPDPEDENLVREYEVQLGHLDPIEEVSGAQGMLQNLGYDCGQVDDDFGTKTNAAIIQFQADYNLEQTGLLDEATLAKLKDPKLT